MKRTKHYFIPRRGLVDQKDWDRYVSNKTRLEHEFPTYTGPIDEVLIKKVINVLKCGGSPDDIRTIVSNPATAFLIFTAAKMLLEKS